MRRVRAGRFPALFQRVESDDAERVEELLRRRGAPDLDAALDDDGNTALRCAAARGAESVVALLLRRGCDANAQHAESGYTALHAAVHNDHEGVVLLLLQHAATDPLRTDALGRCALQLRAGSARCRNAVLRFCLRSEALRERAVALLTAEARSRSADAAADTAAAACKGGGGGGGDGAAAACAEPASASAAPAAAQAEREPAATTYVLLRDTLRCVPATQELVDSLIEARELRERERADALERLGDERKRNIALRSVITQLRGENERIINEASRMFCVPVVRPNDADEGARAVAAPAPQAEECGTSAAVDESAATIAQLEERVEQLTHVAAQLQGERRDAAEQRRRADELAARVRELSAAKDELAAVSNRTAAACAAAEARAAALQRELDDAAALRPTPLRAALDVALPADALRAASFAELQQLVAHLLTLLAGVNSAKDDKMLELLQVATSAAAARYEAAASTDSRQARHDEAAAAHERHCKVCFANAIDTLLLPCKHVCLCSRCANGMPSCPLCRRDVAKHVRVFL